MSRARVIGRLLALVLVLAGVSAGQSTDTVSTLTSESKHVVVPQGALVTIRTVTPRTRAPEDMLLVPEGRLLETRLDTKLDGKLCKAGDPVRLTLVYPFEFGTPAGSIRVPQGAGVLGHVVASAARERRGGRSRLAIAIDSIAWKERTAMLPGIVLATRQPQSEAALAVAEPSQDRGPFDPRSLNPVLLRQTHTRPNNSR